MVNDIIKIDIDWFEGGSITMYIFNGDDLIRSTNSDEIKFLEKDRIKYAGILRLNGTIVGSFYTDYLQLNHLGEVE